MHGHLRGIRARFLLSVLALIACCTAMSLAAIGFGRQDVEYSNQRHAVEIAGLKAAIELSDATARIDRLARAVAADSAERGGATTYQEFRRAVIEAENALRAKTPDDPLVPLLAAMRQTCALVYSGRTADGGNDIEVDQGAVAEARTRLVAVTHHLVAEAGARVADGLERTTLTADAVAVAAVRAMVVSCVSIILALLAIWLGYRRLVLRGTLGRLEAIRDALIPGRPNAARAAIAARGRGDVACMARALEGLCSPVRGRNVARSSVAPPRRGVPDSVHIECLTCRPKGGAARIKAGSYRGA